MAPHRASRRRRADELSYDVRRIGHARVEPLTVAEHPFDGAATAFVAAAATDEIAEIDLQAIAIRRWLRAGREPDGMAL